MIEESTMVLILSALLGVVSIASILTIRSTRVRAERWRMRALETCDKWEASGEQWLEEWCLLFPCVGALQELVDTVSVGGNVWNVMTPAEKALNAYRAFREAQERAIMESAKDVDPAVVRRVHEKFMEKLAAEDPKHPWLRREVRS